LALPNLTYSIRNEEVFIKVWKMVYYLEQLIETNLNCILDNIYKPIIFSIH